MNTTFFQRNKAAVLSSLFLLAIGIVLAAYAIFSILSTQRFIASTPTVEAVVSRVSRRRGSDGRYRTQRYVTYTVDGEEYYSVYAANAKSSAREGDTIVIHYDPENPRKIAVAEQSYTTRALYIAFGLVAVGFGAKRILSVKRADDNRSASTEGEQ